MILGARVLGEFGDDPNRYADAKSRQNYAGTSPITKASGKHRVVLARYARNRHLADAYYLWAFSSLTASPGAQAFYDQRRSAGDTTTEPYGPWPTASSASSTAGSDTVPLYDEHRLGAPSRTGRLTSTAREMSSPPGNGTTAALGNADQWPRRRRRRFGSDHPFPTATWPVRLAFSAGVLPPAVLVRDDRSVADPVAVKRYMRRQYA
jgi:hypothetical protein